MDYVVVFPKIVNSGTKILLVRKDKPEWQKGRLNLVGGKIEPGESPLDAAVRELKEESGLEPVGQPILLGAIYGTWGVVRCIRIPVMDTTICQGEGETEEVFWTDWHSIKDDPLLIPNLRVIIPLMMANMNGWIVEDEGPSQGKATHTISVTVNSCS